MTFPTPSRPDVPVRLLARAVLLAALFVATGAAVGCTGDGGNPPPLGGDDAGSGGGGGFVPPALVGSWYAGRGGTSVPYDPGTGAWGTPNGSGLVYVFEAGGRYTKAFQSYESTGGCTTGYTAFESGRLIVSGDSLTTSPGSGHLVYRATCSPELDSDDPLSELADEVFSWAFVPNEYDPSVTMLYMRRSDGADASFMPL